MGQLPDNIKAWLSLSLLSTIDRRRFFSLISDFDAPERVFEQDEKTLRDTGYLSDKAVEQILANDTAEAVEDELRLIEEHKVSMVTIHDEEYPENLRNTSTPPPLLYVKGTLIKEDRYAVSVVGSRRMTSYGKTMCDQIARYLARCGLTIVSGLAMGIDTIAHKAALAVGGRTIAVLANGLASCYPATNRALCREVEAHGALVSEYPMKAVPHAGAFPERNWIVAGLGLGTVIVEAAEKSGALITARHALEENRNLYAVPGDVNRSRSRGPNQLIQSGALLVMSGEDVLEDMKRQIEGLLTLSRQLSEETEEAPDEDNAEQKILEVIRAEPLQIDDLVAAMEEKSVPRREVITHLLNLEMKGLIRQLPGKVFTSV